MGPLVHGLEISKTFGTGLLATHVLFDVSLQVRPGEIVLLSGPSGSGKTTLVSILAGLMRPTKGRVQLCGEWISEQSVDDVASVRRKGLGFIFQEWHLFPGLSALDNVAEVLVIKGMPRPAARRRGAETLERVGMADRATFLPEQLSSGQKQRVAIARAIAGEPMLLIGDEPTAALDGANAHSVMQLLASYVGRDQAALIVTHDPRLERYAHRVVALRDGRIVGDVRGRRSQEPNA